ncbi:hypothetical protein FA15DRAFT_753086 [Coprinopsis marcescibilis]|uniref:WW domain-containing protein n=1 Tax=Coprinopsis marcescibilis TaxID=230819 RepID=A0A5C3L7P6_COPMA|nr:hypothetical protein FA15DRAFT_753086 [Coprinopsis marcescibilis]
MPSATPPYSSYNTPDSRLPFIETVQYHTQLDSSSIPIPDGWQQYVHPNGDVYYRNGQLRLITPDDIRRPEILQYVLDARDDHLEVISEDPNSENLPDDIEMTISDVSDSAAIIGMFSRRAMRAYQWNERAGKLVVGHQQHFWTHVAEYPSHQRRLPPNAEQEFVSAVQHAKIRLRSGEIFPFTEHQIDQIIALYERHKSRNNIPGLGWLIGVVMPLDSVGSRFNGELEAMMGDLHL